MSTLAPIHARPDTTALLLCHAALRGEFARLAAACRAPGAEPLRAGITDHVALMLDVLRLLHEAEEDVLWPTLAGAAPYLRPELDALGAQRAALAVPIARVRLAAGTATTTAATSDPLGRLADPLAELATAVRRYLAAKEEVCLDAIHSLLPMSAWERSTRPGGGASRPPSSPASRASCCRTAARSSSRTCAPPPADCRASSPSD